MLFLQLLFGIGCLLELTVCFYQLKPLSYLQIPTALSKGSFLYQGLNRKAAIAGAYDFSNNIVYIVGSTSHLLHVVDIADPSSPQLLFSHTFTVGEGVPQSVDVCGDDIAVGLAANTDVNEGHVRFYKTFKKGSGQTDLILDGYITVGSHPSTLKYTEDCGSIVIPNEGEAGKDETGRYRDPEGTISIIHGEKTGNPSVRRVDFQGFDLGQANYKQEVRVPSMFVPTNLLSTLTKFSEDVEPEYVAISSNGRTAWVTLPENNAIAEIDVSGGVISDVYPLPLKSWDQTEIDASDRDGGVHRRTYPGLKSLRQPTVIKSLEIGNKKFLFTADTGAKKLYTRARHGFDWTDASNGRTLSGSIDDSQATLKTNAANDEFLGRLEVSKIDGKSTFNQKYMQLTAFGGRGFSIWDSSNLGSPVFDSDGSLERYMEAFDKSVFNCDYYSSTAAYQSPESFRDSVSDNQGGAVSGLDVMDDNGTVYLVAGTRSPGTLYLYTVDITSGQPVPAFESIYRAGEKDWPWNDLYVNKTAGDLYIADLAIIPSEKSPIDRPLVYVISEGSGSLSLYEIESVVGTGKRR